MAEVAELMPLTAALGATAVTSTPGQVRLRLAWSPDRCTAGGVPPGGARMGPIGRVVQTHTVRRVDR